jgi:hypothetical protein
MSSIVPKNYKDNTKYGININKDKLMIQKYYSLFINSNFL